MEFDINTLKECYCFDLKDEYPYFTQKNLLLVDALVRYNSDYSMTIDQSHPEYKESYTYILKCQKESFFDFEGDTLEKVVKSIDKINSTHLMSEGNSLPKGTKHNGVQKTVGKIEKIKDLKNRMLASDPTVVYEIASAVETKYNFSFATKFCAYVCAFALDKPNGYCIYDDVVQAVLPLYIDRYVNRETALSYCKIVHKNKPNQYLESDVSRLKSRTQKYGYKEYRDIIDRIIKGIEEKDNIKISYTEFDQLLWYYFKGSKNRIQNALNSLL